MMKSLSKTATVSAFDTEVVTARVSSVLRAAFGEQRNVCKRIGNTINRNPRAIKAWMNGECAPSLAAAIELAAHCDELAAEINRLIDERKRQCSLS